MNTRRKITAEFKARLALEEFMKKRVMHKDKACWIRCLLISIFMGFFLCASGMAADGDLDTLFGGDGMITTNIGGNDSHSYCYDMAIQSDGKIVAAGMSKPDAAPTGYDFAVVRYNTDGSLDTSFDGDGIVTTDINGYSEERGTVAIQSDGKIVVAGYIYTTRECAVVRYNTDGSLDTSFSGDGKVTTGISGEIVYIYDVAIQPDEKIVIAGTAQIDGTKHDCVIVRYNTDGSLDTSFGGDGIVTTCLATDAYDAFYTVKIQPDGKIVAAGTSTSSYPNRVFAVVRYNTSGSLDTSFDDDGIVATDVGNGDDSVNSIAIQPDGKILVAGRAYNGGYSDFGVVRYNANGSLDTSFDDDGIVTTAVVVSDSNVASSIAIQSDGKIIVAGYCAADFAAVRYNTDGSLDTSFDGDGMLATDIDGNGGGDYCHAMAIQFDGKIVTAGYYNDEYGCSDFAVVRYGMLDTPPNLISWDNNLVADFGDNGLWYHNGSSWNWMTNKGHVGQMVVWNGKLVVDFGPDYGLQYYDGAGWTWMSNKGDVANMITWNDGGTEKLVVDFGEGRRIYTYNGAWSWFNNKDDVSGLAVWKNKLVVDFGNGRGVYNNDGAWHWMSNKDDVNLMTVWNNGSTERLVVDFGGGRRVYTYNGAWNWLINKDDVHAMAVWNGKLVVDFGAGRGLHNYDTSWHWMSNKDDTAQMVAWNNDTGDQLAVDFGDGRNMYNYNGAWNWIKNANNVPEMVAWNNRLAVDFGSGVGVYNYNDAWNLMRSWSTAD